MTRHLPVARTAARRWLALLATGVLVAVGLVGCTDDPPADPETALVQSVEDTLAGSFAYRLVAEADREALESLGRSLGSVAARLNLFEVSGVVADGAATVDVAAVGTQLLQLRRFPDDATYLRLAAGEGPLGTLLSPELEGQLLGVAVQTDQPQSVVGSIGALFDGDWIGVTGEVDTSLLSELAGGDATDDATAASEDGEDPATPLPEVVADYLTVTDRTEDDGTTTLRVDLRVRDLLRALSRLGDDVDLDALEEQLGALPETVTGDVVTSDGVVHAIVFDVAEGAREAGEDVPGSLQLRLELDDHGEPDVPRVPEAAVEVPSAELTAGLVQLLTTPPPAPTESASPAAP